MNEKYFECNELLKKWPSKTVSISFFMEKGENLSILGKSGSGKSTILNIIAGLTESSSKNTKIILDGKRIDCLECHKRGIGMVFQKPALFQNMDVVHNIAYGLINFGWKKKDALDKASALLEDFDLKGFEKRGTESLSGGEAQRVSLARTLILNPKLLLLDEPFSALDPILQKDMEKFIEEKQKEFNITSIMVTHNIESAKRISSKAIVLNEGFPVWQGKAADLEESLLLKNKAI